MPDPKLANWRTQADIDAEAATAEAERQRIADIRADVRRQDMVDKLRTATPQQISDYIDSNVKDLASARAMLKRIVFVLATVVRE